MGAWPYYRCHTIRFATTGFVCQALQLTMTVGVSEQRILLLETCHQQRNLKLKKAFNYTDSPGSLNVKTESVAKNGNTWIGITV
jgi:hypothetical protein